MADVTRVFLSYARADDKEEPFVARLADALDDAGFRVWFDRWSMPSRALTFLDEIRRAIDDVDRVVAIMGPAALRSDYVRCEWQYALIRGKPVVPLLRLGDYELPPELRNLHCPDARESRRWADVVAEIRNVLREPVPPLGAVDDVPSLPPYFRPRPTELSRVSETVLLDQQQPINSERWKRVTLLAGMGGTGKSVLAAALSRSIETRRAFSDGIYWLDVRRAPEPSAALEILAARVAAHCGKHAETGGAEQRLRSLLQGKRCLIVLDNVERIEQLEFVARCADATSRVLVTTRMKDLVGEAHQVRVEGLEPSEARRQLADWLQLSPDALGADCETILRACDGLPFAIALCGASIASGVAPSAVATRLQALDLAALHQRFPDYEYPGLLPCLEVSVDAAARSSPHAIACLERMGIFAAGTQIPETVIFRSWQAGTGVDEATCSFTLARLCGHSLLRFESEQRTVSVHQLVHAYLALRVPDQRPLHEELLTAYSQVASADWVDGPVDGYYYQHLVHHLLSARGNAAPCALLVGSPKWMERKLAMEGSPLSFLLDVDLAFRHIADTVDALPLLARLAAARHLARRGPRSFGDAVLQASVQLGLQDSALALARANVDSHTRLTQLLSIYAALNRKGETRIELLTEVEHALARGEAPNIAEGIRAELFRLYANVRQVDDALRIWSSIGEETRRGQSWITVVLADLLAQVGRADEAAALQSNLPREALARADTPDLDAAEAAAMALQDGVTRDVALHRLVAESARRGDIVRARAVARAITRPEARVTAMVLIPSEAALQEALDIARTLDGTPRALGLMQVAAALAHRDRFTRSDRLRDRVRRWMGRETPAVTIRETPQNLLAEAERVVETGDLVQRSIALRAMALIPDARARGDSLRLLQAARDAARAIDEPGWRSRELASVAGQYASLDDVPTAIATGRALLVEAMSVAEGTVDPTMATRARASVACAVASARGVDVALELIAGIDDAEERLKALNRLGRLRARVGDVAGVETVLRRMPTSEDGASLLAIALAYAGRHDEALARARAPQHAATVAQIAFALAEQGGGERALQLLDSLPAEAVSTYERASILSANRRFADALALVNEVAEPSWTTLFGPSPRLLALKSIGEWMIRAGVPDQALTLVGDEAGDDEWQAMRATVRAAVAAHRAVSGAPVTQVDEMFASALRCARRAENSFAGPAWRVIALAEVATRLAAARRWRWAFDIVSETHFTIDPFLIAVCEWGETLEASGAGLSARMLTAVTEVFGWQRPDLKTIATRIAGV